LFDTNVASSCEFQWLSSETPQVTNVDPTSGAAGAAIEITGVVAWMAVHLHSLN